MFACFVFFMFVCFGLFCFALFCCLGVFVVSVCLSFCLLCVCCIGIMIGIIMTMAIVMMLITILAKSFWDRCENRNHHPPPQPPYQVSARCYPQCIHSHQRFVCSSSAKLLGNTRSCKISMRDLWHMPNLFWRPTSIPNS